jgi:hypothetical protein
MSDIVNGNSSYNKVRKVDYNISDLKEGLARVSLKNSRTVIGYASPLSAGVYALNDSEGNQIVLSIGEQILLLSGATSPILVGGTSVQIGLSDTPTGAMVNVLTDEVGGPIDAVNNFGLALAALNGNIVRAGDPQYLTVTTVGDNVSGTLRVVLQLA